MTVGTVWSPSTKRIVAVVCGLIGLLILYLGQALIPFLVLAAILAFLLDPIIGFLCRNVHLPRWLAVLLAYFLLLVILVLFTLVGIPAVINAVREVDIDVPGLLVQITQGLSKWLESIRYIQIMEFHADLTPVVDPALATLTGAVPQTMIPSPDRILNSLPSAVELASGFASTIVGTVLSAILAFIFTLIYSIYISLDLPEISQAVVSIIPPMYRPELSQLGKMIRQVWIAYLRGQIVLMFIIGTAVGLGTAALGLPGAALLGVLAGLLEVLPTIGPVTAAIPAILLALVQGSSVLPVSNFFFAVIVTLFYWVIQQLENNLVVPRVIGSAIKVHPILVMAAVVIGASVGGIFGALIASPILATGRVLAHYVYCKLLDQPPFPVDETLIVSGEKSPSLRAMDAWWRTSYATLSHEVAPAVGLIAVAFEKQHPRLHAVGVWLTSLYARLLRSGARLAERAAQAVGRNVPGLKVVGVRLSKLRAVPSHVAAWVVQRKSGRRERGGDPRSRPTAPGGDSTT